MTDNLSLRMSHIGLHVADLDAALAFFCDRLQLDLLSRRTGSDPMVAEMVGQKPEALETATLAFPETETRIRLVGNRAGPSVDADHKNPGTCHVAFYTHDLDSTWANLAEGGTRLVSTEIVKITGNVFEGGKAIYCVGPNGIRVEFLEGRAYLDGSPRDPAAVPNRQRANEASHLGIHVRDRDRSLAFYRDLLGIEVVAAWLEKTPSTKAVIGYPEAELHMAILRMPGTHAYFEVIEYQKTDGRPIDTDNGNNGTCHMAFAVDDLDEVHDRLRRFGAPILSGGIVDLPDGGRGLWCTDPDGIRVQFTESGA